MLAKVFFKENGFIISNIYVMLCKKQMSKTQAKKLSFKFVPYLFVALIILTTFGSNSGTWA